MYFKFFIYNFVLVKYLYFCWLYICILYAHCFSLKSIIIKKKIQIKRSGKWRINFSDPFINQKQSDKKNSFAWLFSQSKSIGKWRIQFFWSFSHSKMIGKWRTIFSASSFSEKSKNKYFSSITFWSSENIDTFFNVK